MGVYKDIVETMKKTKDANVVWRSQKLYDQLMTKARRINNMKNEFNWVNSSLEKAYLACGIEIEKLYKDRNLSDKEKLEKGDYACEKCKDSVNEAIDHMINVLKSNKIY